MKKILSFVFGASVSSILFRLFILTVISWLIWTPNLKFMWISGESMTPTYEDGDVVLLKLNQYKKEGPKRFDPVVVWWEHRSELLFKRIIGLPGEKIEIKGGHIFIDGTELKDNFGVGYDDHFDMELTVVQPNHYFVIGDDRDDSVCGFFHKDQIIGKALY